MASTYTGLGTELMTTGENAGNWGTKTNVNLQILEQIAGGALRADTRAIQLGFAQYKGLMMHFGEVVEMTRLALKQGDAILDPTSRTQDNLEIVNSFSKLKTLVPMVNFPVFKTLTIAATSP